MNRAGASLRNNGRETEKNNIRHNKKIIENDVEKHHKQRV